MTWQRESVAKVLACMKLKHCSYCGGDITEGEYVHNGVGMQQVSPDVCDECGASQIGANCMPRTERERETYWHAPDSDRFVGFAGEPIEIHDDYVDALTYALDAMLTTDEMRASHGLDPLPAASNASGRTKT